jgi:hypothetical protein
MGRATGSDRVLEHIVAMLVALAVQAERAAGRSFPVRWLVLAILRRAELAACACVAEVTRCEWSWLEDPVELRCDPADAILLAARLRMLAAVLASLLCAARIYPGSSRRIGGGRCLTLRTVRPAVIPAGLAAGPYDTS